MSDEQGKPRNLEGVLDDVEGAAEDQDRVSIEAMQNVLGKRTFGPMLMIPGLIALSPLSGVPGTPTVVGMMVLLISGQFLLGQSSFWLPQWVLKRSVSRSRFDKAMKFMRPVARFVDHFIKPRLTVLVDGPAGYAIAAVCLLLAITAPMLEVIPFAITGVGAAVTAFGIALISDDGLLAFIALICCAGTSYLIVDLLL